ncbi:hypothetical protein MSTE_00858 [Mycobacteroides stephanolepidis]|uniref:Uncharacterized protein n=1 Tax=[Mycobacterium] stephanolepidis TaxID=1520670 RepID=A0A1Z4ETC8_9MYCO|nr:RsiV family protein [[Mycobacterium] stephanolepidis]BAX96193.1 hypothetical protein MSTE_00858 [[Mycobacterium] stephanolepidis]
MMMRLPGIVFMTMALTVPTAAAAPDNWCVSSLRGTWDGGACLVTVTSNSKATMDISVQLPDEVIDDSTVGPVLRAYAERRVSEWRKAGDTNVRDSSSAIDSRVYVHSNSVKSVVLHEVWRTEGTNANNAYRTFTFDLAQGRRLVLADLFRPGVDPRTALPPLARPFLLDALDAAAPPHDPGSYPFATQEWEPQPDGSGYSGEYRAFALTGDELILYMPDVPMAHENPTPRDRLVWSMDGGAVTVRIPLPSLRPILRAGL